MIETKLRPQKELQAAHDLVIKNRQDKYRKYLYDNSMEIIKEIIEEVANGDKTKQLHLGLRIADDKQLTKKTIGEYQDVVDKITKQLKEAGYKYELTYTTRNDAASLVIHLLNNK